MLYLSRDNAQSFAERHIVDAFQRQGEGGYTTTILTGPRKVQMTWYADEGNNPITLHIKLATITVANRPQWLWIRLLEKLHAGAMLHVYYNNERCSLEDSHGHAIPVDGHATQPTETIRRAVREILTLHFPDELSRFGMQCATCPASQRI